MKIYIAGKITGNKKYKEILLDVNEFAKDDRFITNILTFLLIIVIFFFTRIFPSKRLHCLWESAFLPSNSYLL